MFTCDPGVLPKKLRKLCQRRLILVDIENVLGTATYCADDVVGARALIEGLVGPITNEQVYVSSSHRGMFELYRGWDGARLGFRSGPDGADLVLLKELSYSDIVERFTDVVLVSGDGIFTDAVVRLTAQGVRATVVAPIDGCSRRLEMAATNVLKFERTLFVEGGAA